MGGEFRGSLKREIVLLVVHADRVKFQWNR